MIKRNKKLIKTILCSIAITGLLQNGANAISIHQNIKINSNLVITGLKESEDERRLKLVQEYQNNKFLKDFVDAVQDFQQNSSKKGHQEQLASVLDISQKMQLAKNSGNLSKEAMEFVNEVIQDIEPAYSNLLNEGKNKGMKPAPVPPKEEKDDIQPIPKKTKDDIKPIPKEKQKQQEEKKKQENTKPKEKKSLPKTGTSLNNIILTKIGVAFSLMGIYIMKNKK